MRALYRDRCVDASARSLLLLLVVMMLQRNLSTFRVSETCFIDA
jgi:hypothetical protein